MRIFVRVVMVLVTVRHISARNCNANLNQIIQPETVTDRLKRVITNTDDENASTVKPRNRCCPYDFDSSLCKMVGDRYLCGYNVNRGAPYNNHGTIKLNDGCRLKGGRLECGYEKGPFTNPRRPAPFWGDVSHYSAEKSDQKNSDGSESDNDLVNDDPLLVTPNTLKLYYTKSRNRPVTRCVEIQNRIVCRRL